MTVWADCPLCAASGEDLLWQSSHCRVILVDDPRFPGFCRVVWTEHIREMSDLPPAERSLLMEVVFAVESVLRRLYQPDKINLASFGNVVPHLHWHIIPRWRDDSHFPEPIWGTVQREIVTRPATIDGAKLGSLIRLELERITDRFSAN